MSISKSLVAAASAAMLALTVMTGPAVAAPIDKGHFHDVFTEFFPDFCGVEAQLDADVRGNFLLNTRGKDGPPLYRESVHGSLIWTNLETGNTFTEVFSASSREVEATENDDGTFTVLVHAAGGYRVYDSTGKLFLRDPGMTRFRVLLDANREFIEFIDTVRESTGLNETEGRNFCEDFLAITA